jgi:hypothetical protein
MINIDYFNVEKLNEGPHFIVITLKNRIEEVIDWTFECFLAMEGAK